MPFLKNDAQMFFSEYFLSSFLSAVVRIPNLKTEFWEKSHKKSKMAPIFFHICRQTSLNNLHYKKNTQVNKLCLMVTKLTEI